MAEPSSNRSMWEDIEENWEDLEWIWNEGGDSLSAPPDQLVTMTLVEDTAELVPADAI